MEKQWQDLIDYLEYQKADAEATKKMYQKDRDTNGKLWHNHDLLIACCNARWNQADLTIHKMNRLKPQ